MTPSAALHEISSGQDYKGHKPQLCTRPFKHAAVRCTHCTQPLCSTCIVLPCRLLHCVCPKMYASPPHLVTGVAALLVASTRPIAGAAVSVVAPVQQVLVLLRPYLHTGSPALKKRTAQPRVPCLASFTSAGLTPVDQVLDLCNNRRGIFTRTLFKQAHLVLCYSVWDDFAVLIQPPLVYVMILRKSSSSNRPYNQLEQPHQLDHGSRAPDHRQGDPGDQTCLAPHQGASPH